MEDTFETKDIITATYLNACGHYCIGTIPANNRYKPQERLWLFARTEQLLEDIEVIKGHGNPSMPIRDVFRCSSILKNLLNDKDD